MLNGDDQALQDPNTTYSLLNDDEICLHDDENTDTYFNDNREVDKD